MSWAIYFFDHKLRWRGSILQGHFDRITGEYLSVEVVSPWDLEFVCVFVFLVFSVFLLLAPVPLRCSLLRLWSRWQWHLLCPCAWSPRRCFGKERSVLGEGNVLTLLPNPNIFPP